MQVSQLKTPLSFIKSFSIFLFIIILSGCLPSEENAIDNANSLISISVTPTTSTTTLGGTKQFSATGIYSDDSNRDITANVIWSSSDTTIATVNTGGLVTTKAVGSVIISAGMGNINSDTSNESASITVTNATLISIAVTPPNPSVALGSVSQFTATGTYSDSSTQDITTTVTWISSNVATATISNTANSEGLATTLAIGNSTISASLNGINSTNTNESGSLTVTGVGLVSIAVTPANPTIQSNMEQQFSATGTYSDASTQDITNNVTWTSSNNTVAFIEATGLAVSIGAGSTTMAASLDGISSNDSTQSASLIVTEAIQLVSISVTPATASLVAGSTQQFTATAVYSDSSTQDVTSSATWYSSSTGIASMSNAVSSEGLATTLTAGNVIISAVLNGFSSDTTSESASLNVSAATLVSISVTPSNPSIALGLTQQLTATGVYSNSTTQDITTSVTWASTNTTTASISNAVASEGLATSVAIGSSTISATLGSITSTNTSESAALTITNASLVSIAITPSNVSIPAGLTQQFTATGTFTDSSTQDITNTVSWASSQTSAITISNTTKGLATNTGTGTTPVAATLNGISSNNTSQSATLTVTSAQVVSIAVTPSIPSVPLGLTQQFTATGTLTDGSQSNLTSSATWSSTTTGVATISNTPGSQGLLTSVTLGTSTIAASFNAISSNDTSASSSLTVSAATLASIAVSPLTATITKTSTQQFTATGTYTDASTLDITTSVTWASTNTAVATISNAVSSEGLATGTGSSTSTISATLGGISSADSSESASLTVYKIIYISSTGSNANSGLDSTLPRLTISTSGLASGDEVRVAGGTYSIGSAIVLTGGVKLLGGYSADFTVRNIATNTTIVQDTRTTTAASTTPHRVFEAVGISVDSSTVLDGFTIIGAAQIGGADWSAGIFINSSAAPTITNNTIFGGSANSYGIYGADFSSRPVIMYNNINGGGDGSVATASHYGIFITGSNAKISNNMIFGGSGNATYGIRLVSSGSIINNTIDGGTGTNATAIAIDYNAPSTIINNIITTSTAGSGYGINFGDSRGAKTNVIRNNTIYGVTYTYYDHYDSLNAASCAGNGDGDGNSASCSLAEMEAMTTGHTATGNVALTPLYTNYSGADTIVSTMGDNDWTLAAGTSVNVTEGGLDGVVQGWSFTDDKAGVTRTATIPGVPSNIDAAGWSIGAFEY